MKDRPYFKQLYPSDNPVTVLKNLLSILKVPIDPIEVDRKVYGHPDFPFISLRHLLEFLRFWQFDANPIKIEQNLIGKVTLPAIGFIESKNGAFVVIESWDGENVQYLHPGIGWIVEPLSDFIRSWPGVLLLVAPPVDFKAKDHLEVANQKAGIAVTLVNAEATLDSFIRYHLGIGFEHIFLFFDKPNDASINIAKTFNDVTVILRDELLEERWKKCKLYPEFAHQIDRPEVRQLLNVEIGVHLGIEHQLDWLLQIDVDELFYSPSQSVADHFTSLAQEQIYHANYLNYESVPEQVEVGDYFRQVTLFKKNPGLLNKHQQQIIESGNLGGISLGFLAYSNGKSAGRIEDGLLPWGNHHFQFQKGRVRYHKKDGSASNANKDFPVILHFAECGFSHFWNKYQTWGQFPDHFLGGQRIADYVPFRIAARDIVLAGDTEQARVFYERNVVLKDYEALNFLLKEEILIRISDPSNVLEGQSDASSPVGKLLK